MLSFSDVKDPSLLFINTWRHPFSIGNVILALIFLISISTHDKKHSLQIPGSHLLVFVDLHKDIEVINLILLLIALLGLQEPHLL
jgi:hypothetical protein